MTDTKKYFFKKHTLYYYDDKIFFEKAKIYTYNYFQNDLNV